jgi:hypothetical protein
MLIPLAEEAPKSVVFNPAAPAMTIAITCPSCKKQSGAPDQCAGQTGQCPFCSAAVSIPAAVKTLKAVTWTVRLRTGQTWGPVNRRQLDEAVATGRLSGDSLVWQADPTKAVQLVDMYPQLRQTLAAEQAPFSGQQLQSAVRPKTFLERLFIGPEMPRYKADRRRETFEERQLIFYTFIGVWVLVLLCGTILAGLQGGVEAAVGAALGFVFASLLPVGVGLLSIAAGLFEPEWLMNCWEGRRRRWLCGDQGARYTYMVPGFLMFIGGGLFACFVMAVGGIGGSTLAKAGPEEEIAKIGESNFDPPLPGYTAAGLVKPKFGDFDPTAPGVMNSATGAFIDPLATTPVAAATTETITADASSISSDAASRLQDEANLKDVTYQLKTREESLRNAISAYGKLREQWDAAYNKSADLLKKTGGLASDSKGELKAADEAAMAIARTLSVSVDSVKASHADLKQYCDEQKSFSEVLAGYSEPPAIFPGLQEIERRSQVAQLALATGEEFVFLDSVTKVEQLERQRRELAKNLGTATGTNEEFVKLENDLQDARKWAYQARRTVEQKSTRGQVSPLLQIYPADKESIARFGTDPEQRDLGLNPALADRFKEASRQFLLARTEVDRSRARTNKAEQAIEAYKTRFGRNPNPTDPVGQNYTTALKAFASAEKKLAEARTTLEGAATKLGISSSLLAPIGQ